MSQVMDMVDITWGVAAYLSNGEHVAGDLLLGKTTLKLDTCCPRRFREATRELVRNLSC
jgi:hypothetical protein